MRIQWMKNRNMDLLLLAKPSISPGFQPAARRSREWGNGNAFPHMPVPIPTAYGVQLWIPFLRYSSFYRFLHEGEIKSQYSHSFPTASTVRTNTLPSQLSIAPGAEKHSEFRGAGTGSAGR